jgi:TrmH family RNA methyltransferase
MQSHDVITSAENPHVRLARSLLDAAGRRRQGAFLVEGTRLVEAAASSGTPRLVLHSERYGRSDGRERGLLRQLRGMGVPVRTVAERVLAHATDTVTPQGIVAVVPIPGGPSGSSGAAQPAPSGTAPVAADLVLILDAVGDPGNAGTLLRSAAGAGASRVVATRGTVDLYAPKVVRAGAGAHFYVDLATGVAWDDVAAALPPGVQVVVADAGAARAYWDVDWRRPSALVVGSEPHGVSEAARDRADVTVAIPIRDVESLNAGVAGSVMLFEALRQRSCGSGQEAGSPN